MNTGRTFTMTQYVQPVANWLFSRPRLVLFVISFVVLLRTMAPTVYELDSAELSTGAALLGIVHAPGYPLYVMIAHLFTLLPVGDIGFRVNLFSVVCIALTAPVTFSMVDLLINDKRIAAVTALLFVWSYYLWSSGTAAEIYASQVFTLALCGWWLAKSYRSGRKDVAWILSGGLLFGVAVAMAPSSVFFAPGMVAAFLLLRLPLKRSIAAGLLGGLLFLSTLVYFPLRANADPDFNKIGTYDAQGIFHNFDFQTPQGILQAISGQQFHYLFFANGVVPTLGELTTVFSWFWRNYLGIGVVLGLFGLIYLWRQRRGLFWGWLALIIPYTYFYTCYGASDRDTMLGPTYLVWTVPLAFGLAATVRYLVLRWPQLTPVRNLAYGLPLLALIVNFSAVDLSTATSMRTYEAAVLQALPANAVVVGYWPDVAPMQYLHFVEHIRPDVKIYDAFLFPADKLRTYLDTMSRTDTTPVVITTRAVPVLLGTPYTIQPIWGPSPLPAPVSVAQLPFITGFRIVSPGGQGERLG